MQEHLTISLDRQTWGNPLSQSELRPVARGRGDAVLEELKAAGPLLGPREERGEEGDSEVIPEGGEGNPEFLEYATYTRKCRVSRIPQL